MIELAILVAGLSGGFMIGMMWLSSRMTALETGPAYFLQKFIMYEEELPKNLRHNMIEEARQTMEDYYHGV